MSLRVQVTQPSDPSYRIIALTQEQVTLVDTADFEWLNQWKWCALWMPTARAFYVVRNTPQDANGKQHRVTLAREIMKAPEGIFVDHEDHDSLNNRRYNLRLATRSQNGCNRRKHRMKSSAEATYNADSQTVSNIETQIAAATSPLAGAQATVATDVTSYNSALDALIAAATDAKIPA